MTKEFRYQHLRSSISGAKPSAAEIREGELAVNLTDEKIYLKNSSNKIVDFITENEINEKIISADEEDLTVVNNDSTNIMSFKDKVYNKSDYSGLGRIYLRKNIKEISGITSNYLEQCMIDESNTIYVIQYDYDLNGEEISIPANCILYFNGGSINNGTLNGNYTKIVSNSDDIFENIRINGTWEIHEILSSWFKDATNENVLQQVFALQNENMLNTIIIGSGDYLVSVPEDNSSALICKSNLNLIIDGNINLIPNSFGHYYILECKSVNHVNISGAGSIVGDKDSHLGDTGEWGMGIEIAGSSFITVKDLGIKDCWGDCIYIGGNGASNIIIDNCNIDNGRRQGISITNGDNIVISNCRITNVKGTNPQAAIDIETNKNKHASNIIISNVFVKDCLLGIVVYGRNSYTKSSITVDNCYIDCTWRAIAANGMSTCMSVKNCEIHTLYCSIEANTVDGSKDNVILFENNMIYQNEIPTEYPYNTSTRMCAIYALKGDYMFKHNNIYATMPVFNFASGNKYVENNDIECPTLFYEHSVINSKIIGNKISGNITIPGGRCLFEGNTVNGYWRTTFAETEGGSRIIGNFISHPLSGSELTYNWESTLVDGEGQPIQVENYNKIVEIKDDTSIISNNTLTNVALKMTGGIVSENRINFNKNFTLTSIILMNIGNSDFLYNDVKYGGDNENDTNIYIIRSNKNIIGNDVTSISRIKCVFYATDGCFISNNTINLPEDHEINHIIPESASLFVEPVYSTKGAYEKRPIFPIGERYYFGCKYFDTTLQKAIVWNGYVWTDMDGEPVDYMYKMVIDDYNIGKRINTRYTIGTELSLELINYNTMDCKVIDVLAGQVAIIKGVGGNNSTTFGVVNSDNILLDRDEPIVISSVLPNDYPQTYVIKFNVDGKLVVNFFNERAKITKEGDPNYGNVVPYYNNMNVPYECVIYSKNPFE